MLLVMPKLVGQVENHVQPGPVSRALPTTMFFYVGFTSDRPLRTSEDRNLPVITLVPSRFLDSAKSSVFHLDEGLKKGGSHFVGLAGRDGICSESVSCSCCGQILDMNTVSLITFGSGKQLFPGWTATVINSGTGLLPVEINHPTHFK